MVKPKSIKNEDVERIREQLSHRDGIIFDLSLETGLRISDILNLKVKDISILLTVRESKTKKWKTVKLSENLYERLDRLKPSNAKGDYFVFRSKNKPYAHIDRSTYHRHLKKACRALEIDFSAHSTRKLYAWNVFEISENIFDVQKSLQHEFITTTAKYLDIDIAQLINSELRSRKALQHNHKNVDRQQKDTQLQSF